LAALAKASLRPLFFDAATVFALTGALAADLADAATRLNFALAVFAFVATERPEIFVFFTAFATAFLAGLTGFLTFADGLTALLFLVALDFDDFFSVFDGRSDVFFFDVFLRVDMADLLPIRTFRPRDKFSALTARSLAARSLATQTGLA
jgi:hypothetical protein